MAKRVISFEIDDEIAGHFDALVHEWGKDPAWLARAFFEEEVKGQTAGSRGVPLRRRFIYRDATPYFTAEELEQRSVERERKLAEENMEEHEAAKRELTSVLERKGRIRS